MRRIRRRVYEILDVGRKGDRLSEWADIALITLISLNVVSVIFESVQGIYDAAPMFFNGFELFSVSIFTIEYVLRVWSAPDYVEIKFRHPFWGRLRFMLTPMQLLDLIVILPFYLVFFVQVDLRMLRVLRLLRVFRLTRYSSSMGLLLQVLKKEGRNIGAALFVLLLLIIMAASLTYLAEQNAQPEAFGLIPDALWWAVITMTTVGYGDVVPITVMGRILGAVIGIISVGMVALPAGLLASGFSQALQRRRAAFEAVVGDILEDGVIDSDERVRLRETQVQLGLSKDEAETILRQSHLRAAKTGGGDSRRVPAQESRPEVCPHCGGVLPHRRNTDEDRVS
ncbi:MAG: ion transporter [Alphaproteobacteria bacterium]|nr:ion transporter [Alphaproteobacteria bacterium]